MSAAEIAWIVVGCIAALFILYFAISFYPEAARTIKIHRM